MSIRVTRLLLGLTSSPTSRLRRLRLWPLLVLGRSLKRRSCWWSRTVWRSVLSSFSIAVAGNNLVRFWCNRIGSFWVVDSSKSYVGGGWNCQESQHWRQEIWPNTTTLRWGLTTFAFSSPASRQSGSLEKGRTVKKLSASWGTLAFCRQNTLSHDTFVHLQRITERTAQMLQSRITRGSRIAHCGVSKIICHPSVMSHMLPHLPQNTSARSLSLTPLVIRPSSPGAQEEIPVLPGSIPCWFDLIHSSNSRPLLRKTHQSYIARQRVVTEWVRRAHLPRWKLHGTHSIVQLALILGGTDVKKGDKRCSLRPWIQCTSIIIEKRSTTWHSPGLQCTNCQDTTNSDARTSFDHSDKHGGMNRETCRGEIDFRIQGLSHSAFQEHENRQSRNWFASSRITWTKKHYKQTQNKIARSIRSASSRRKWSTAWKTWSSYRFARFLPTSKPRL